MPIIAVASAKGGVGKTTVSTHLTAALALFGARCMLVDLDPQGAAGALLQVEDFNPTDSSTHQLRHAETLTTFPSKEIPELQILPAHPESDSLQHEIEDGKFRHLLQRSKKDFDFIIFDLPPVLEPVTLWALREADSALVVIRPTALSVRTLPSLLKKIVKQKSNTKLEGIVLNQLTQNPMMQKTVQTLKQSFGRWIFPISIPYDDVIQESALQGSNVFSSNSRCPSAQAYQNMARELLLRYAFSHLL